MLPVKQLAIATALGFLLDLGTLLWQAKHDVTRAIRLLESITAITLTQCWLNRDIMRIAHPDLLEITTEAGGVFGVWRHKRGGKGTLIDVVNKRKRSTAESGMLVTIKNLHTNHVALDERLAARPARTSHRIGRFCK
jgi:hypothetical protein